MAKNPYQTHGASIPPVRYTFAYRPCRFYKACYRPNFVMLATIIKPFKISGAENFFNLWISFGLDVSGAFLGTLGENPLHGY